MGYKKKKTWKIQTEKFDDTITYQRNGKTVIRIHKPQSDEYLAKRRARVPSRDECLEICFEKHGDKYDYSLVEFETTGSKVKIICPVHGIFEQRFGDHMRGFGCSRCGGSGKVSDEEWMIRFKETYGDKYDYSKVVFERGKKITVICPIHGEFQTRTKDHWAGKGGCPECRKDKIRKAKLGTRLVKTDLNKIRELREEGYTISDIQDELGLSRGTVQRRLKEIESLSKT